MKKKKKDDEIVVTSLGNSTDDVTGSCWTISYLKNDGTRGLVVLECGLSQDGNNVEQIYNQNKRMLENVGKDVVEACEYLILGHAHIDHVGNTPFFNSDNGFKGKVFASKETIEESKELIKDSVYIHQKNVEYLKTKGKRVRPLYTEPQMYDMFEHMENMEVGKEVKLNDNLSVHLRYNSHTLGSTNITVTITKPNNQKKVVCYSSDMGSKYNLKVSRYLKEQDIPKKCNLFISEATYCDKSRQMSYDMAIKEREELKNVIKKSLLEGRRILLPTFAFSRSQLLLTYFYEWFSNEDWFKDIPVVVDGVLVNNMNNVYLKVLEGEEKELFENVMNWRNLKVNRAYDSTIATLSQRTSGIYITSSGFLQNGRITTYLPHFLENSRDVIIMTGYCGGEGSIGYNLLDPNQTTLTVDKRVIQKNATIISYKSFSSHISYDELLELWSEMNCDKILIHHSGSDKNKMIEEAREYLSKKNKTTKLVPVNKGAYQFVL